MQSILRKPSIAATPPAPSEAAVVAAWLEAFPGPAVVFDGADAPVAATTAGEAFLQEIDTVSHRAQHESVHRLVAAARRSGAATRETVARPCGTRWLEINAIPSPSDHVVVIVRDATLDARVQHTLVDSRQRYKDLADLAGDFVWETDAAGAFTFVSTGQILG